MKKALFFALNTLFQLVTKEMLVGFVTSGLKRVKEFAAKTDTKLDDVAVEASSEMVLAALKIPGNTNVMNETARLFKVLGGYSTMYIDAGLTYLENYFEENTFKDDMIELATGLVRKLIS